MNDKLQSIASRRKFILNSGRTVLAGALLPSFVRSQDSKGIQSQQQVLPTYSDTIPVKLTPLDVPSEKVVPPPPAPLSPDKRIGFAVVGLGHLSLENILPAFGQSLYAKPVALVSGNEDKAKQVAEQYGIPATGIYNYENYDDIKNNKDVQAIYIVLPNSMHKDFTVRGAAAGKHILCEKPMATSSKDAQIMIDACKKADRKLMIAYRINYEPHNLLIRDWVQSKKFGKTRFIEMFNGQNIGDPTQWRLNKKLSGGGSLPDIGIYCLNTARFLTGEEPEWLNATIYTTPGDERFKEVEESVMFQLRFPSGTIVSAGCSYGVHESRRYRCMADNGAWFGMDPAFSYNGLKIEMDEVRDKKVWKEVPAFPPKDQFALEIDHFAKCILDNKEPNTTGETGLKDHVLMEALYQSAKENRPITLK